jgi:hypothetical protein
MFVLSKKPASLKKHTANAAQPSAAAPVTFLTSPNRKLSSSAQHARAASRAGRA